MAGIRNQRLLQRSARRRFLQASTASLFTPLIAARATAASMRSTETPTAPNENCGRAKRCILIYLLGGPPHIDMWDLKPAAPREIRGSFSPIATAVPGIDICEHLPRIAQHAQRLTILRSLSYPNNDHPYMIYQTLTGRVSPTPLGANTVLPPSRSDYPHMGSVVSKLRHRSANVPGYVAIPEVRVRMGPMPVSGGGRAGFLGPRYDPLSINEDPRMPIELLHLPEDVSDARFEARRDLLAILDGRSMHSGHSADYDLTRQSALQLSGSMGSGGMFDLDDEPAARRDAYGRHRFGQSLLLGRRLIERGVSFVGVHFNYMSKCDGWDTHKNNFKCLQEELLPMLDQGLSALADDLDARGLLDETLVVTMGEFGRSPRINANAGRDHWGNCASAVFMGGGTRGGRVIGASDDTASYPTSDRVGPDDVVASIYHAMGLNPDQLMYDRLDRPQPLSTGTPIRALFS